MIKVHIGWPVSTTIETPVVPRIGERFSYRHMRIKITDVVYEIQEDGSLEASVELEQ